MPRSDALDGRVVALQKDRLVGQHQRLAAPGCADDDPVAAIPLPPQGLLVVVQGLQALGLLGIAPLPRPVRQLDPNLREHQLLQVLDVLG